MYVDLVTPSEEQVSALAHVEELAWNAPGANVGASAQKLRARVHSFPEGVTLATVAEQAAGSQYAFRLDWDGDPQSLRSWDEHTAQGWTDKVHCASGNTGFLVGVGVVPAFRGTRFRHSLRWPGSYKLSELLIARTLDILFASGVRQVIGNARVPAYHTKLTMPIPEYCRLRRPDGALYDPVLRFHERMGAQVFKPVEYSMEDPESGNAGCWIVYRHRFEG